jgi:hypothetical protein
MRRRLAGVVLGAALALPSASAQAQVCEPRGTDEQRLTAYGDCREGRWDKQIIFGADINFTATASCNENGWRENTFRHSASVLAWGACGAVPPGSSEPGCAPWITQGLSRLQGNRQPYWINVQDIEVDSAGNCQPVQADYIEGDFQAEDCMGDFCCGDGAVWACVSAGRVFSHDDCTCRPCLEARSQSWGGGGDTCSEPPPPPPPPPGCDPDGSGERECQDSGGQWDSGSCTCSWGCDPIEEAHCRDLGGNWNAGNCTCEYVTGCSPELEIQCWERGNEWGWDPNNCECQCDPSGDARRRCDEEYGWWRDDECYCDTSVID